MSLLHIFYPKILKWIQFGQIFAPISKIVLAKISFRQHFRFVYTIQKKFVSVLMQLKEMVQFQISFYLHLKFEIILVLQNYYTIIYTCRFHLISKWITLFWLLVCEFGKFGIKLILLLFKMWDLFTYIFFVFFYRLDRTVWSSGLRWIFR